MEVIFLPDAESELRYWIATGNKSVIKKITLLIEDIQLHPYTGLGKPEPLKHRLSGVWSRRITIKHRLIYEIIENKMYILSVKGHYK